MRSLRTAALLSLLALPASAGFKDGVYTNADRGVRFKVPTGWRQEASKQDDGRVCQFVGGEGETGAILFRREDGWKTADHAKWRTKEWEKKFSMVTWEKEEKLKKSPGEWLLVEMTMESDGDDWRTVHVFVANGKENWELIARCPDEKYGDQEKGILAMMDSFELGEFKDEGDDPAPEPGPEPGAGGDPVVGGSLWADPGRGLAVRGAKGWKPVIDSEQFKVHDPYEILEFQTGDADLAVLLSEMPNDGKITARFLADATVKALRKSFKNQKMLEGPAPEGTERRDFRADSGDTGLRFAIVFFARNDKLYYLQAICAEAKWDEKKDDVEGAIASLTQGDVSGLVAEAKKAPADEPGETPGATEPGGTDPKPTDPGDGKEVLMPNPWKGCGKGSWVKYKVVSEASGTKTEMEMTFTLVDSDEESYTQSTEMVMNGSKLPATEQKVSLRQKAPEGAGGTKPEEGDEAVTVAKGEFKCHWVKTTTDQGWSQAWNCPDVPMGMVKTVSEFTGMKSTMELVDFEKK